MESKYRELNSLDWLRQKYEIEGLSTKKIAELIGARTPNSVRQYLLKYGIPLRSIREGLVKNREHDGFRLNAETQQIIEGSLLGDGCLYSYNRESDASAPIFKKRNKFRDHIAFVCSGIGVHHSRIRKSIEQVGGTKCVVHSFKTLSHDSLMALFRRWYPPARFKKIVPINLTLTPTILLHWFLDDGSSSWRNRKYPDGWQQRKKQVVMSFSSESFTREENQFLCDQMKETFGISCSVTSVNSGTGWRIKVLQSSVSTFLEIIGLCPFASLAYKWKIPS